MGKYTLPDLPYAYDALEPHIDARTMEIHHTKHHQTYIDKLNAALADKPELSDQPVDELLRNFARRARPSSQPRFATTAAATPTTACSGRSSRPNGGGRARGRPWRRRSTTSSARSSKFKKLFTNNALNHFGSGWSWLVVANGPAAFPTACPTRTRR